MVQAYKYLGVWITTNGNYIKAQQAQANQGKKDYKDYLQSLKHPLITIALKLFDVMILPLLCYGCELWGQALNPELEAIETHFLKYILNSPQSATNMAVHGELGQLPLHRLRRQRILCYWNRLCSEEIPDFLREAFDLATWMHQSGKTTRVSKVKSCLMRQSRKQTKDLQIVQVPIPTGGLPLPSEGGKVSHSSH